MRLAEKALRETVQFRTAPPIDNGSEGFPAAAWISARLDLWQFRIVYTAGAARRELPRTAQNCPFQNNRLNCAAQLRLSKTEPRFQMSQRFFSAFRRLGGCICLD